MSDRIIVHAEYAEDGTIAPFQLSTGAPYTVELPARTVYIRLVGEEGEPRVGEAFRVELSSGEVVEGTLDDNGEGEVETIDGVGELSFPNLADEDSA